MAKQSNSALSKDLQEKILTFLDGLSHIQVTPPHRIYQDETGYLDVTVSTNGDQSFIVCDTKLNGPFTLSTFKHWRKVIQTFEDDLKSRGIYRYLAMVDSYEKFRWCEWVGMHTTEITIGGVAEVMAKEF